MISANVAAGNFVLPTQQVTIQSRPQVPPTAPPPLVEIKIDEAPDEAQSRVVVEAVPEEEEESLEEEEDDDEDDDEDEEITGPEQMEEEEEDWELCNINPRKRSSIDFDDDDEDHDANADGDEAERLVRNRSGSLSKRLRREEDYIKDVPAASPTRLKKRSSEELDDDEGNDEGDGTITLTLDGRDSASPKKRSRLDSTPSESPPVSIIGTSTGESDSVPTTGDDEDELDLSSAGTPHGGKASTRMPLSKHPRGLTTPMIMNEAAMAKLYSFDSAGGGVAASLDGGEVDI